MLPRVGPCLFTVPGISNVPFPPGFTPSVVFRWPRDLFVTGVLLFPLSATPADLGALFLQIQDETFQQIISDGQGGSFSVSPMTLNGGITPAAGGPQSGFRRFVLQRPVAKGDEWIVTVRNNSSVRTITPALQFYFEEAYES